MMGGYMKLLLNDGSMFPLTSTTMLVFFDETGDETMNDPEHPVFGFGGCYVLAKDYMNYICKPWETLRKEYFRLNPEQVFHARKHKKVMKNDGNDLQPFFSNPFWRFAITTSKAINNSTIMSVLEILFRNLHNRLIKEFNTTECTGILFIYDNCGRLVPKLNDILKGIDISAHRPDGTPIDFPVEYILMNKKDLEPGHEVTDLIMYIVGQAIKSKYHGLFSLHKDNKSLSNLFGGGNEHLSWLFDVDAVKNS